MPLVSLARHRQDKVAHRPRQKLLEGLLVQTPCASMQKGEKVASEYWSLVVLMWQPSRSSSLDRLQALAACEAF